MLSLKSLFVGAVTASALMIAPAHAATDSSSSSTEQKLPQSSTKLSESQLRAIDAKRAAAAQQAIAKERARIKAKRAKVAKKRAAIAKAQRIKLQKQRKAAANTSGRVMKEAAKHRGTPYRWGGTTPSGFDCAGYVQWVYKKATGTKLPRMAGAQAAKGKKISKGSKKKGDLIVFRRGGFAYHIGIYAGDGKIWHSPRTGKTVEKVKIWTGGYEVRRLSNIKSAPTVSSASALIAAANY